MTPMLSRMTRHDIRLSSIPPLRKLSKNPGPTCRPMQNTKRMRPKSCMKLRISVGAVKPMCPARMPANSTKVTPNEMPPTLILPNSTPTKMTMAKSSDMWATELVSVKILINQSIILIVCLGIASWLGTHPPRKNPNRLGGQLGLFGQMLSPVGMGQFMLSL